MTLQVFQRLPSRLRSLALALLFPALVLGWWEWESRQSTGHAYAFAPLEQIGRSFAEMLADGSLPLHAGASLQRALTALLIGGSIGVATGIATGLSRLLDRTASPLITTMRQVPILGWLPLVALWFGNGDGAKLLLVSLSAFYPTVLNTQKGMQAVEQRYAEVGRLYGFTRMQALRLIAWPSALPLIFTGISQALAFSWIATIGVELLFSATAGLGTEMMAAQVAARTDVVLVCVACVGVMGFTLNQLLALLRARLLRWQGAAAR
jgi:sulfonate transport system permease protein